MNISYSTCNKIRACVTTTTGKKIQDVSALSSWWIWCIWNKMVSIYSIYPIEKWLVGCTFSSIKKREANQSVKNSDVFCSFSFFVHVLKCTKYLENGKLQTESFDTSSHRTIVVCCCFRFSHFFYLQLCERRWFFYSRWCKLWSAISLETMILMYNFYFRCPFK